MVIEITGTTGGQSPYDVFLCNTGGTSCFYVSGNTNIPPSIIIDTENYFPTEETLLLRLIDTNGCVFDEIQDCTSGATGTCVCNEYEIKWGHPGIISVSYDPCCPSGETITQNVSFPTTFLFSSSTTPNIISGFGGVVSLVGDICPCEETTTYYCTTVNVLIPSTISWLDSNNNPQSQFISSGFYDLLCTQSGSVSSDNGPESFIISLGTLCVDDSLCIT